MAETYTVTRREIPWSPADGDHPLPLGRHVRHDSRSLAYLYQAPEGLVLADTLWPRFIPILDQGDVGSCTGNAMTGCLGSSPLFPALPAGHAVLNEAEALVIYSQAETIDGDGPYPPNDNGSSGLSVAQAAKADGLISGYQHATTLAATQAALMTGPVIIGISWYDSFDTPDASGLVAIAKGASVRGGHEVLVRGLDMTHGLLHLDNSWGTSWGLDGSFSMSFATYTRLLAEQGDCTIPLPLSVPAPVPTPVPTPTPVPVPPDTDEDEWLVGQLGPWAAERHVGANERAVRAYQSWKAAKGL